MKSIFLGTGASEGIPAIYCECETCNKARINGGKDIRTRTDFLIDEYNIIDYGPDIYMQCLKNNVLLRKLKNIFITHFHDDHISVSELAYRLSGFPELKDNVNIYGSEEALKMIQKLFEHYKDHTNVNSNNYFKHYTLNPLLPNNTYKLDGISVTPILSSHLGYGINEWGFNYIINDSRKRTFLYAVDTGWYTDETWEFINNNDIKLDFIISECTYGDYELPDYSSGHLDYKNLLKMLDRMNGYNIINKETPIYITHICHLNSLLHNDFQNKCNDSGWNIKVAFDGMTI